MKIVDETAHAWVVECEAKGCHTEIVVQKRIKQGGQTWLVEKPKQRWCSQHPPGSTAK